MVKIIKSKILISVLFVSLLCVCLGFSAALPASAAERTPTDSGSCGNNITWEYYEETAELVVSGSGTLGSFSPMGGGMPWHPYYETVKTVKISEGITGIGYGSFRWYSALTDVKIASSVEIIGADAFTHCASLESVVFEENSRLTSIGESAFSCCTALKAITIPSAVTEISSYAFGDCYSLASVVFEENSRLTDIGERAFEICYDLAAVELPSSLTSIGERAFMGCGTLTSIVIPSSVSSIGDYAFSACYKLLEVYNLSGVEILYENGFNRFGFHNAKAIHTSKDEKSIIENINGFQIAYIEEAYSDYTKGYYLLGYTGEETSLILPTSFEHNGTWVDKYRIHNYAFQNCTELTAIKIPTSVVSIGDSAFEICPSIEALTVEEGNAFYYSSQNCIIEKATKTLVAGCKNSVIPQNEGITAIDEHAFCGCTGIKSVEIPSSVEVIGQGAFAGCSSLESVLIGEDSKLTGIAWGVFQKCEALTSIELPSVIKSISRFAFSECNLTSITLWSEEPVELLGNDNDHFFGNALLEAIYVPAQLVDEYKAHEKWAEYADMIFAIPEKPTPTESGSCGENATWEYYEETGELKIVGSGKMDDYSIYTSLAPWSHLEVKSVVVSESITSIGGFAFYCGYGITSVDFGENSQITSIGEYAFYGCASLISIEIPAKVTGIGELAFYQCGELESVAFEEGCQLTSIAEGTFQMCYALKNIEIPSSVTAIEDCAFEQCYALESIKIPSSVKSIGYSFATCRALKSVIIEDNSQLTSIGDAAFGNCLALETVIFGENSQLASIGRGAFGGCGALKSIEIPSAVTSIGEYAFSECSLLSEVVFGENSPLESIGNNAFEGSALTSIEIPSAVTSIGEFAFSSCSSLVSVVFEDGSQLTSIGKHAFSYCAKLTAIEIPSGVTCIENSTLYCCHSLASVVFEEGSLLESIGFGAFKACYELSYIEIPSGVTGIAENAFSSCTALISVKFLAATPPTLDYPVFYYPGVKAIYVPASALDTYKANESWSEYKDIIFAGDNVSAPTASGSCGENAVWLYYEETGELKILGSGEMDAYSGKKPWGDYIYDIKTVTVADGITSIGKNAFRSCFSLTSVVLGENSQLASIGAQAFEDCISLTSIQIPSNVTSIDRYAFMGCNKLVEVYNFSELDIACGSSSSDKLGSHAKVVHTSRDEESIIENIDGYQFAYFKDTYYLLGYTREGTELILPAAFTYKESAVNRYEIYGYAFSKKSNVKSIQIPSSVVGIGSLAFKNCIALETITVNEGNTVYHSSGNCIIKTATKELVVGCKNSVIPNDGSVKSIGIGAFYECSSLKSLEIPSSVTSIGASAFYACSSLKSLEIPSSVKSIGPVAFSNCSALTSITLLSSEPASLGMTPFLNSGIAAIYVPASALDVYKAHESWSGYKDIIFPTESTDAPEIKYGDANNDDSVSALDVLLLRKYMANYNYSTGASTVEVQAGADVNGDGDIGASDVLLIRKYMANYNYTTGSSSVVLGPNS